MGVFALMKTEYSSKKESIYYIYKVISVI